MEKGFFSKYWWVILLIVLAVIWYFMYMKKQAAAIKTPTTTDPNACTATTLTDWNNRVNTYITAIEANPDWVDYISNNLESGETLTQAKKRHAEFMVIDTDKKCKPAGAA